MCAATASCVMAHHRKCILYLFIYLYYRKRKLCADRQENASKSHDISHPDKTQSQKKKGEIPKIKVNKRAGRRSVAI